MDKLVYLTGGFNNHVIATGCSGCGKTTAMISLILQKVHAGEKVVVINWHRCLEVENIMPELRQKYIDNCKKIDVGKDGLTVPLFSNMPVGDGGMESDIEVVERVTANLNVAGRLTRDMKAYMNDCVDAVFEAGLYANEGLAAVANYLDIQEKSMAKKTLGRVKRLCTLVKPGEFMMDKTERGIFEFDLNTLQYDEQNVIARFIIDYVYRRANNNEYKEKGITFFIDECQNLEFSKGSLMFNMINEARKLSVSLLLATPRIMAVGSRANMSVISQCATALYFAPAREDLNKIAKEISPQKANKFTYKLSLLKTGQCILKGDHLIGEQEYSEPIEITVTIPDFNQK